MNTKSIFSCFLFLILAYSGSFAQGILVNLSSNDGQGGQIELTQPEHLENLLMMHIANNRLQNGIPGYRILIFSQSGQTAKQRAEDTRGNFMRNFPGIEAYPQYNTPNFQIFVGDFRTKNEALRELKKIERRFPIAFIAPAIIVIQ